MSTYQKPSSSFKYVQLQFFKRTCLACENCRMRKGTTLMYCDADATIWRSEGCDKWAPNQEIVSRNPSLKQFFDIKE